MNNMYLAFREALIIGISISQIGVLEHDPKKTLGLSTVNERREQIKHYPVSMHCMQHFYSIKVRYI